jgi:farnesyl diphosphate synthase
MNIKQYLQARQERINSFLLSILPPTDQSPAHLHKAMHYAVLNGGKRVRPLLVYATGEAFNVDLSLLDHPASALELIHAYSLVHDDLPAMDNDDLRRGLPTCHKAFDEATAILVGDSLQSLAFQMLTESHNFLDSKACVAMLRCLAIASGSYGMAGGQALDIKATGQQLDSEQLKQIHDLKTGALITAAIQLGLASAQITDQGIINDFTNFATLLGLCFQIQDDILDAEGSVAETGKEVRKDGTKQKVTFITHSGLDEAKRSLQQYHGKAMAFLTPYGDSVTALKELANYIIERNH